MVFVETSADLSLQPSITHRIDSRSVRNYHNIQFNIEKDVIGASGAVVARPLCILQGCGRSRVRSPSCPAFWSCHRLFPVHCMAGILFNQFASSLEMKISILVWYRKVVEDRAFALIFRTSEWILRMLCGDENSRMTYLGAELSSKGVECMRCML